MDEKKEWDRRYREKSDSSKQPDPLLVEGFDEYINVLFPQGGTALDAAGGVGRHAIWLAERRWRIRLVDISEVAIAEAEKNAADFRRQIDFEVADLTTYEFPREQYDLVLVFFYLERKILGELAKSLRPGGLLIYKTYTELQPTFGKGPTHPMHLLKENELLHAFPGFRLLHYRETLRDRGVAEFIGRKI